MVEDYALVLYTHVSRSSCCFHVALRSHPARLLSLALCRHVSPLQNGLLLLIGHPLIFFLFFFTSKYPQNFLLKFMEEGNGITEKMWNKSGIYVTFS